MRRPRITAAAVSWELTDEEVIRHAFETLRHQYKSSVIFDVVCNRLDGVERQAIAGLERALDKSYYGL